VLVHAPTEVTITSVADSSTVRVYPASNSSLDTFIATTPNILSDILKGPADAPIVDIIMDTDFVAIFF
jgi:hypothetical protein